MSAPFQEKGARRRLDRPRTAFTFTRIHTAKATFGAAHRVYLFCLFEYEDRASLVSFKLRRVISESIIFGSNCIVVPLLFSVFFPLANWG